MNAEQPAEPPPPPPPTTPPEEEPPVVIHTPVVTTQQRLMLDGSYKTITTTDGVESPTLTNTYYTISYPATSFGVNSSSFKDSTLYKCFASQIYSDNTTYTKTTQQPKIKMSDVKTITNVNVPQFKFRDLNDFDVVEIFNNDYNFLFPYIKILTATRETWSDGRVYTI